MSEMNQTKALQQALITVGSGAIIVYIIFALIGADSAGMGPALITLIVLSSLVLIPFVYKRYLVKPEELTRKQHLTRALIYVGLLTFYLIHGSSKAGLFHFVSSQFLTLASLAGILLNHLRQSLKAEKPELRSYEY
jgi:hypothetical protein